jgi:hypothetical protein
MELPPFLICFEGFPQPANATVHIRFDRAYRLLEKLSDFRVAIALDMPEHDCHALPLGQLGKPSREPLTQLRLLQHRIGL